MLFNRPKLPGANVNRKAVIVQAFKRSSAARQILVVSKRHEVDMTAKEPSQRTNGLHVSV
jgi:hypothetical protein